MNIKERSGILEKTGIEKLIRRKIGSSKKAWQILRISFSFTNMEMRAKAISIRDFLISSGIAKIYH